MFLKRLDGMPVRRGLCGIRPHQFLGYGVVARGDRGEDVAGVARDGGSWGHSREITLPSGDKMMFGPPAGTGDGGANPAVDVQ